jgi:hypothetical protein
MGIIEYIAWLVSLVFAAVDSYTDEIQWAEFHQDAYDEYASEFDAIFNSLSVKSTRKDQGIRVTVRRSNGRIARSHLVKAA